jgi:6-phospho-beta-glucosidase
MGIKIAVIGGASSYTPELFANLAEGYRQLEVNQVSLMDLNTEKLTLIAEVCERLVQNSDMSIRVITTQRYEQALAGADFVILQIRIGGLEARVRDETLPMKFGMVGNETTGAGGFVCALRTIPVVLDIAKEIEKIAPEAWLLNLSNPAGIVAEALLKHSKVKTLGFCNIPINTTYALAEVLEVDPEDIQLDSFGLNHLSWTRGVYLNGKELLQPLFDEVKDLDAILYQRGLVEPLINPVWLRTLRMIPGWYLRYFYCTDEVLEEDKGSQQPKGVDDMHAEKRLREIYSTVGYNQEARGILESKGGAQYYLPVLNVINSMVHDRDDVIVVDTTNGDTLPDLPPEVCVEVPARVSRAKVEPLPSGRMPLTVRGLVQAVKTYEELTIEAAINGDKGTAIAALMANPLVSSNNKAKEFFDRVLENERAYLPQFFKGASD